MHVLDSIDGLGLGFEHLSPMGREVAIYRATKLLDRNMSDEDREAVAQALLKSKGLSDAFQARLRKLIGTETPKVD